MSRTKTIGLGLLLVGMLAGAAGATAVQNFGPPSFLDWGLFTLAADEEVHFNVTLREVRGGPQAQVLQQLFDRSGVLVARQTVTLAPGKSATLRYTLPGEFSAHAEILDLSTVRLEAAESSPARSKFLGGVPLASMPGLLPCRRSRTA